MSGISGTSVMSIIRKPANRSAKQSVNNSQITGENSSQVNCDKNNGNNVNDNNMGIKTKIVTSLVPEKSTYCLKTRFTINNFSQLIQSNKKSIKSSVFNIGLNTKWYLKLIRADEANKDTLGIYLYLHEYVLNDSGNNRNNNANSIRAKFNVSIINCDEEEVEDEDIDMRCFEVEGNGWGVEEFIDVEDLLENSSELLPNDVLTLCFNIEVIDTKYYNSDNDTDPDGFEYDFQCINYNNNSTDHDILKDFAAIMHNKELSDFKFVVSGREFFVHKNILSARSTVFAAMFSADMIEKRDNCGQINDIDADVFEQLLHFIYTGKTFQIRAMANKLLSAAEMYNIVQLKSMCEDIIFSELIDSKAISTLIFADRYNALKLRDRVIEFIASKFVTIRNVNVIEWKAFIDGYPNLVDKVFKAIGNNQRNDDSDCSDDSHHRNIKRYCSVKNWIYRNF